MFKLFYKFSQNLTASLFGPNIIFHIVAIISTYIFVISGFDWLYFTSTQIPILRIILFPAIVVGGLLPLMAPVVLYVVGRIIKSKKTIIAAFAVGQAAILGSLYSSLYKAFTGRVQPNLADSLTDISHNWQFGFMRHGIFWGWPSSHTTIAFAMSLALILLFPKNKFIKYGAIIYAFYIGLGISISIHWFSEFIAGALIGTAIGLVVGKSFKKMLSE